MFRVDPEAGASVALTSETPGGVCHLVKASENLTPIRTPSGQRVFSVTFEGGSGSALRFARFDESTNLMTIAESPVATGGGTRSWVCAIPKDDALLAVHGGRAIEQWWFGSTRKDLLFPRDAP